MAPIVQNSLIMFALLVAAVTLIQFVIWRIAGKGMVRTFSTLILTIVVIDCELAYILGQLPLTPLNVVLIYTPGIAITLGVIYWLFRIVVLPIRAITAAADRLATGDLRVEISAAGGNEMGQLAASLSEMVAYQREMAHVAGQIAAGELGVAVPVKSGQDELGQAFQGMVRQLNRALGQVSASAFSLRDSSQRLSAAARQAGQATNQIASTIQQVAAGAAQQSGSISDTATAVDQVVRSIDGVARGAAEQSRAVAQAGSVSSQLSEIIQQVSGNARVGAQGSEKASQVAQNGSQTVSASMQGMQSIQEKVALSARKVAEMGAHSQQIGVIVETIEDIASQTNLLALNAAIEAARAGEHGKGFAVVADEVRKLAERSASSTKEIAQLVHGIQNTVREAVTAMEEGSGEVERGVSQASQAGRALNEILSSIREVNQQVRAIASAAEKMDHLSGGLTGATAAVSEVVQENTAATRQMSAGAAQVSQAIDNISSVSEENSAAIEEISASTEEMSAQVSEVNSAAQTLAQMAAGLLEVVSQFKLAEETGPVNAAPEPDRPRSGQRLGIESRSAVAA